MHDFSCQEHKITLTLYLQNVMTTVMASVVKVAVVKIAKVYVTRKQECVQIAKVDGKETIAVKVRIIFICIFVSVTHVFGWRNSNI